MPYQDKITQKTSEENKKTRPEGQHVPEQLSFGMPNSLMSAVPMTPTAGMPNSIMREMEPEDRGALFRGHGFDPSVGAHELSHTVRRESVPGPVRQSVPSGTIQRDPDPSATTTTTTTTTTVPDEDEDELNLMLDGDDEDFDFGFETVTGDPEKKYKQAKKAFKEREAIEAKREKLVEKELAKRKKEEDKRAKANQKEAKKRFFGKSDEKSNEDRKWNIGGAISAHLEDATYREEEPGFFDSVLGFFRKKK